MRIGTTLALAAAVVLGASQITLAQGTLPGAGASGSDGSMRSEGYPAATNDGAMGQVPAAAVNSKKKGAKVQAEQKMDMGSDSGKR